MIPRGASGAFPPRAASVPASPTSPPPPPRALPRGPARSGQPPPGRRPPGLDVVRRPRVAGDRETPARGGVAPDLGWAGEVERGLGLVGEPHHRRARAVLREPAQRRRPL